MCIALLIVTTQSIQVLISLAEKATGAEKADHIFSLLRESAGTPQTYEEHEQLASIAIVEEDYESALTHLWDALALVPQEDTALLAAVQMRIGSVLTLLERYDEAIAALDAALALTPEDAQTILLRAQVLLEQGEYERAAEALEAYHAVDPEDSSVISVLSQLYDQLGAYEKARVYYELLVSMDSEDLASLLNLARCDYMLGSYTDAIAGYDAYLDRAEDTDGFVHFMRGISHLSSGAYEAAAADMETALAMDYAEKAICYEQLSLAYYAMDDFERALSNGEAAAAIGGDQLDNGVLYQRLGVSAMSLGKYDSAIAYLTTSLEVSPGLNGNYYYRGACHLASEDYTAAIKDFTASIDLGQLLQFCAYNRGVCYVQLGDYDSAMVDMEQAFSLKEDASLVEASRDVLLQLAMHFREEDGVAPEAIEIPDTDTPGIQEP
ncbi:tetratricopeptide repeat protein [Eubacteriales bacterium OttesenSCG-928-A19]|nr:tetratricopeptide repeat protein [Eubacteriales bacterium OttesenSCG-928-A19]